MFVPLRDKIHRLAHQYLAETVEIRRHLHRYPELSFEEFNTSLFIRKYLDDIGVPYQVVANTGVVAMLEGSSACSEQVIALRADMDALPIQEVPGRSYGSKNSGVMHACGHDVHTASLLGTVRILKTLQTEFAGTVKFIFQPGEEKLPGGASLMIKEGVLLDPAPRAILGQHVMPFIETGKVGFRSGKYMASSDELYMTIKGKGGHGALPHQNVDPIAISAQIITALQQVVSRFADPRIPTVLSWGKIVGSGATNIIPDEVRLEGTFRTFDEGWRTQAHRKIEKMAIGIAESMGALCDLRIVRGYPYLINQPELTEKTRSFAEDYLGENNVVDLDLWPAAEDFAYYSHEVDACFYRLGTGNEAKGIVSAVHTPTFDIDEDALKIGIGLMAYLTMRQLDS